MGTLNRFSTLVTSIFPISREFLFVCSTLNPPICLKVATEKQRMQTQRNKIPASAVLFKTFYRHLGMICCTKLLRWIIARQYTFHILLAVEPLWFLIRNWRQCRHIQITKYKLSVIEYLYFNLKSHESQIECNEEDLIRIKFFGLEWVLSLFVCFTERCLNSIFRFSLEGS